MKSCLPFLAGFLLFAFLCTAADQNGVLREVYAGIAGNNVTDLTSAGIYPNSPTSEEILTGGFEAPTGVGDEYGQRLRAILIAPATGNYRFWVASDDGSDLYLSFDENPVNKRVIARVTGWTNPREWGREAGQASSLIQLTNGQRYYVEALMKEGSGGDNLCVRWQLPSGSMEEPIPHSRLLVFGMGPPSITAQPANFNTVEGGNATFRVQLARAIGASCQWFRDGAVLPGETNFILNLRGLPLSATGQRFYCSITNSLGWTNSNEAVLTVTADSTRPRILSAGNSGDPRIVSIAFSEPLDEMAAEVAENYAINNNVRILSASLGSDGQTVYLRTTVLASGVNYLLTVNNLKDRAASGNVILTNSQAGFSLNFTPLDAVYIRGAMEAIGPSSRRSGFAISEIMYHPIERADGRNLEFIEIFNSNPWPEKMDNYRLSGAISYTFPSNTTIGARSFLTIAAVPADVSFVYGGNHLGPYTGALENEGGTINLRDPWGALLLEASFSPEDSHAIAADGAGHSLVLARPSYGEANPQAWAASDVVGGSPGRDDPRTNDSLRTILINEWFARSLPPNEEDFIELYNYGAQSLNLSGCILTDDPQTNRFVFPPNTQIAPKGFVVVRQSQLGFGLNASGEAIFLMSGGKTRVIDAVRFGGQEQSLSSGRFPDGSTKVAFLSQPTPGTNNLSPYVPNLVINEIMYNPITRIDGDEYIEILNASTNPVDLAGWRFSDGVSFTFPVGATIPGGGFLVVAKNSARLLTTYPHLNSSNCFGNFNGTMANSGERLVLQKPEINVTTIGGVSETNRFWVTVDEVTYGTGGRWGKWSDGGGSSLELVDYRADNSIAQNWRDSDESTKSGWMTIEKTGVLDHGGMAPANAVHLMLLGAGECLVDDVEVVSGAANLVSNPTFSGSLSPWVVQGNHDDSRVTSLAGINGTGALHLIAQGRGDTGANRIRSPLSATVASGATATLRAKVRWLKGHPEFLMRFYGNWLEATGNILTTRAFGTPGQPNSVGSINTGPAIESVTHSPILPAANQAVTVVAKADDPDGVAALILRYRVDPSTNYNAVPMAYNLAGLYSAVIPAQPSGAMVAFYIQAADGMLESSQFPQSAPTHECLIRFGEPASQGTLGSYRIWMTASNVNRWTTREKNSNKPLDATFVYGNSRIVYNAQTLYSGSPFHTPGYNGPLGGCDYVLITPKDDLVLGSTDFILEYPSDGTFLRHQASFWIGQQIGAPYLYRRFIFAWFNGQRRGTVMEDAQQPNSDLVKEFFSDDDNGSLHKIEDWFEFDDSGDRMLGNTDATLGNFTTTGGEKKLARYRWNWRPRAVRESVNDFTNLFALVDAVRLPRPEPYKTRVDELVDIDAWMRIFALERICGNWDSYGAGRGKNMYAYKPQNTGWVLFPWDIEFTLGSGGDGPTAALYGGENVTSTMMTFPPFARSLWQAYSDAVNGPLLMSNMEAMLRSRAAGLQANSVAGADVGSITNYVIQRRDYIVSNLNAITAPFAVNTSVIVTNNNLIQLTGSAPIEVREILINGRYYPITWTTVSNWAVAFEVVPGQQSIALTGRNNSGVIVPGATASISVNYTGANETVDQKVIINEIMYNPASPGGAFIEILNISSSVTFNLGGFELRGAGFTFPAGTLLRPGAFLLVVEDKTAFERIYGTGVNIVGEFEGELDRGGETISIIQKLSYNREAVVDEVTYEDDFPWPALADGIGSSLQLIDPTRDNNRIANWASIAASTNSGPQLLVSITNTWKFNQTANLDGTQWYSPAYNDSSWPSGPALLFVEEAALPAPKLTPLTIGRTTYYFRTKFNFSGNPSAVGLSLTTIIDDGAIFYLNGQELFRTNMPAAATYATFASENILDAVYQGPYRLPSALLKESENILAVEVHQSTASSGDIAFGCRLETTTETLLAATPGMQNSVRRSLPPFADLRLNEIQLPHPTGVSDLGGDLDAWLEIVNTGTNAATLNGLAISSFNQLSNRWLFPTNQSIPAGGFKVVWMDGESHEHSANEWHSSVALTQAADMVILWAGTNILDVLSYELPLSTRSFGLFPDGKISQARSFYFVTPGNPNNPTSGPVEVFINEWMADNNSIIDPADQDLDDWFELYNGSTNLADISGYFLTDNLTNKTQFRIPPGTILAGNGLLRVWADEETGQTRPGDLHVNFRLSASADSIGLFDPQGKLIDSVTFSNQAANRSEGRYPDGSDNILQLTNNSPGLRNVPYAANHAPRLAEVPELRVVIGSTLQFAIEASDEDLGQTRTFFLDETAPGGLSIQPSSGVLSWTPLLHQAGTHEVLIGVTDDGVPALSAYKQVTIRVISVPVALEVSRSESKSGVRIQWQVEPGLRYRVEYKDTLEDPEWFTLEVFDSDSTTRATQDEFGLRPRRFYRLGL